MKIIYKVPSYEYSASSLAEFITIDGIWSQAIFKVYPELEQYRDYTNNIECNPTLKDEFYTSVEKIYSERMSDLEKIRVQNQIDWDKNQEIIEQVFHEKFGIDVSNIFNNLICNLSLNPSSPRFLTRGEFDCFYRNNPSEATGSALHELVHFVWFKIWRKTFRDNINNYESPHLIWILSEAVVELYLDDPRLDEINPFHKTRNAYASFYSMKIDGKLLYDYLGDLFAKETTQNFMRKSYEFMKKHEHEIRQQF